MGWTAVKGVAVDPLRSANWTNSAVAMSCMFYDRDVR